MAIVYMYTQIHHTKPSKWAWRVLAVRLQMYDQIWITSHGLKRCDININILLNSHVKTSNSCVFVLVSSIVIPWWQWRVSCPRTPNDRPTSTTWATKISSQIRKKGQRLAFHNLLIAGCMDVFSWQTQSRRDFWISSFKTALCRWRMWGNISYFSQWSDQWAAQGTKALLEMTPEKLINVAPLKR